jgi:mannose-6-phosphate isomerase-like protein (cupin superfamily)
MARHLVARMLGMGRSRGSYTLRGNSGHLGDRPQAQGRDASVRAPDHYGSERTVQHFTIATIAEKSADFRRVLWTGEHSQLVIMTIPPGGEIGEEVHEENDQILTFVAGTGEARVGGEVREVNQGDLVAVPAGTRHNFINTGVNPLVLYTVYGPPDHADGTVHHTKEEADREEG